MHSGYRSRTHKRHTKRNVRRKTYRSKKTYKGPARPLGGNRGGLKKRHLTPYVESKAYETTKTSPVPLNTEAATLLLPAQTTLIIPPAWADGLKQGFAQNQFTGVSVFDRFLTMKLKMTFLNVGDADADNGPINNIRCVQGWIKRKLLPTTAASTAVEAETFHTVAGRAMLEDGWGSEFLKFSEKWRNIKVIRSFMVKPVNRQKAFNEQVDAEHELMPINMKFNWTIKRKQLLSADIDTPPNFIRGDSWIPFVAFYSASLAYYDDATVPEVEHISKIWYTDS